MLSLTGRAESRRHNKSVAAMSNPNTNNQVGSLIKFLSSSLPLRRGVGLLAQLLPELSLQDFKDTAKC